MLINSDALSNWHYGSYQIYM